MFNHHLLSVTDSDMSDEKDGCYHLSKKTVWQAHLLGSFLVLEAKEMDRYQLRYIIGIQRGGYEVDLL